MKSKSQIETIAQLIDCFLSSLNIMHVFLFMLATLYQLTKRKKQPRTNWTAIYMKQLKSRLPELFNLDNAVGKNIKIWKIEQQATYFAQLTLILSSWSCSLLDGIKNSQNSSSVSFGLRTTSKFFFTWRLAFWPTNVPRNWERVSENTIQIISKQSHHKKTILISFFIATNPNENYWWLIWRESIWQITNV